MAFRHYLTFLIALQVLSTTGCGRQLNWTQDALLHDGRVLLVERNSVFNSPFPGNSGMEIRQTLTFSHPDTGERITWRLPDGLQPIMLDFEQGAPYYVLNEYTVLDYNKWGCPNPPYIVYLYKKGVWKQVDFSQLPKVFVVRNMAKMAKEIRGLKDGSHISIQGMENYWDQYKNITDFRKISREKINPIGNGCYEDVLIKMGRKAEIDNRR